MLFELNINSNRVLVHLLDIGHKSQFLLPLGLPFLHIGNACKPSFILGRKEGLAVADDFSLDISEGGFESGFLKLALPDDDDVPAFGFQLTPNILVALLVP